MPYFQVRFHRNGVRSWSVIIAAVLLVPLLLISLLQAFNVQIDSSERIRDDLARRTNSIAKDVGFRLDEIAHMLEILAATRSPGSDRSAELYALAKLSAGKIRGVQSIGLVDAEGQMLWVTAKPFGTRLPAPPETAASKRMFATLRPTVSGLFRGPYTGQKVASLAVPVYDQGRLVYGLVAVLNQGVIAEFLADEALPGDWIASIFDGDNFIMARTRAADQFVGTRAASAMVAFLDGGGDGAFSLTTKEGLHSSGYTAPVQGWGWRIGVAVPDDVIFGPLRHALMVVVAQLALGLVLALWLAARFGRYLERWFDGVVTAVRASANGEPKELVPSGVGELDQIARTLIHECADKHTMRATLVDSERNRQDLATQLEGAKLDLLTGLLRRKFFIDALLALKDQADADPALQVGLAFLDLNDFKALNDQHGHQAGDLALQQVGQVLARHVGASWVAGRWGGDEFIVALLGRADALPTQLPALVQTLSAEIAAAVPDLGVSVGTAVWDSGCHSLDELIHRADSAMYSRKSVSRARRHLRLVGQQAQPDRRAGLGGA